MSLLPETVRRVDALVAEAQATGRTPSLIAGIVRHGGLTHLAAAGEAPRPDADTQYRIGSITKTMTAVLVMQLRDEGRLRLDDPLDQHLPGTPVGGVTLRQLLGHASGLQREPETDWWERSAGIDLPRLLAGLTAEKLAHPPYRTYHYSNLAYALLGGVVERLTEQPWWTTLRTRLLDPLGMRRTTYQAEEPFARGYLVHPWHDTLREEPRTDTGAMAPAGQLWSTPTDLAKWAAFLADPDPAMLAPATLTEMYAPVIMTDLDSWTSGHGLGVEMFRAGERVYVGHGGSMPGYVASLWIHRPARTGVVLFANSYGFRAITALGARLLTTVLDDEPALPTRTWRPAAGPPPSHAAELTGRWWWMGREYDVRWDHEANELVFNLLNAGGAIPWRFTQQTTDRWRCRTGNNNGEIMTVRRDPTSSVTELNIATFIFSRDPEHVA